MTEKAGPGPRNAITDVGGLKVGQAEDLNARTGVTVIVPAEPCVCAVDVRGGGPGTRETDALSPETLVDRVDAVVLSGGSVYGLGAADGVTAALGAERKGFSLVPRDDVPVSPIVPAAVLYDLAGEGDKQWGQTPPYARLGREALESAQVDISLGPYGAGLGARAGAGQGGIGSASFVTEDGWEVGAIAAVNSFGSPYMPEQNCFWAWPYEINAEFGGRTPSGKVPPSVDLPSDTKIGSAAHRSNTTICVIAVNANIAKPMPGVSQ